MDILWNTLTALLPLYIMLAAGVAARKGGVIPEDLVPPMNKVVFKILLPCSLFVSIYKADLSGEAVGRMLLFLAIVIPLEIVACLFAATKMEREDRPAAATTAQAMFRSNYVLLGSVYTQLLYGSAGLAVAGIMNIVVIPLFNAMSVLDFAILTGEKQKPGKVFLQIIGNPLIIGCALGLAAKLSGITVPAPILTAVNNIGSASTPIAMMTVGASLTMSGLIGNRRRILRVCAARLLIIPLITVFLAVLVGLRGVQLITILTVFGSPSAVASVAMSYALGGDGKLAGEYVAATTLLSIFTMFFFILALRGLGLC